MSERYELRAVAEGAADAWDTATKSHQPILRDCSDALIQAADEFDRLQAELSNDAEINPCGHARHWTAYSDPTDRRSSLYCVFCEMDRLRTIVDLLPKDGTGKPIPPGAVLWVADPQRGVFKLRASDLDVTGNQYGDLQWSDCYLDREAAEKAKQP